MWIRRELKVFNFLFSSRELPSDHEPNHRPSDAIILLEYVIFILKTIDIQGSNGQAEGIIQEFLGRSHARLFLHELKAWLRSPYNSLGAWDCNVQYVDTIPPPGASQNGEGGFADRLNIALKYAEPAEARKAPPSHAWRLYIFKGNDVLRIIELSERSVWLLGREERVVDVVTSHPSCSGQHAALQFRDSVRNYATQQDKRRVRPYLIDLDSVNGTSLNGKRVEIARYIEIRHGDVIKLGTSAREYVVILPPI